IGRAPSLLWIVRVTSARPSAGRPAVPAKTTSSILPPRSGLTPCSPITQENASTTLDLPDPFGPTTQVIPGSKRSEVAEANDLNPRKVRVFRYTRRLSSSAPDLLPGLSRSCPRSVSLVRLCQLCVSSVGQLCRQLCQPLSCAGSGPA